MDATKAFAKSKSGRSAKILLEAQDESESVVVVKYRGEKTQHLRNLKSFIFSTEEEVKVDESSDHARVLVNLVGVNVDLTDGQLDEINNALSNVLDYLPFTLQYDYVDTTLKSENSESNPPMEDKTSQTSDASDAEVKILLNADPNASTPERKKVFDAEHDSEGQVERMPSQKVEEDTVQHILDDLANAPKEEGQNSTILNPFGEPLTDADIQYAFDQCDENGDQRIQFKEFRKCVLDLGIDISDEDVKKLFNKADADDNHVLSFDEFKTALLKVQPDDLEIWSKWLAKSTLEMKPGPNDLTVEQIAKALSTTKANWQDRIEHMHALAKHAVQPMNQKKFNNVMRPIREPLLTQLSDRRSAVVREACIVIAKICLVQQDKMTRWAPRILEVLFETIRINVEVMAISAHQAAKALIKCVPDGKKLEILAKLEKASVGKYIIVRQRAFEYINILLDITEAEGVKRTGTFWKKVMTMTTAGMQDSSGVVRDCASDVCGRLYKINPEKTKANIISKLRRAMADKFMKSVE